MTLVSPTLELSERVDAVLEEFLAGQEKHWQDAARSIVLDAVRRFVGTGGKRLRPAFCYWGWRGAGQEGPDDVAVIAGAALELFHCFALIHDDIIDGSSRRRGRPSMHEAFAAHHAGRRWQGDSVLFGQHIALLCGDLCASWADHLFANCGAAPERLRAAQELFAAARAEAIAGEYLDVLAQAIGGHDDPGAVDRALQVARLKTARYSIARPLQIGGTLAGANARLLHGYGVLGDSLGEAFQLRDDVLGVFGDSARTGKSTLDDLRLGKPTVLLALTFANADRRQRKLLRSLVGKAEMDDAGADAVRTIMVDCGALEATEHRISLGHRQALRSISACAIGSDVREALLSLTNLAVDRSY